MAGHYAEAGKGAARSSAVFISYAKEQDDPAHEESVLRLWELLRSYGVDARLDLAEASQRRDWALWRTQQIREAGYVLVIASPAYRRHAEGRGEASEERSVQWEARLIRDAFFADQRTLHRVVPVVLPGRSEHDVPDFLGSDVYPVTDFTLEGAERLLRLLTDQPEIVEPPLGAKPDLKPRKASPSTPVRRHPAHVHNEAHDVSGFLIQVGSVGSMTVPGPSGVRPGEGADPRTKRAFEAACRAAGLGDPTGPVFAEGPGFVQHFADDTVLCALAGRKAVTVAGPVWDDLSALPGFPDSTGFPTESADATARVVDLDGGAWGAGTLLRDLEPRWQPQPRLSMEAWEAFQLPVANPLTLTVRAIATLPLRLDDDLEITRRTRERLEAALSYAEISAHTSGSWERAGRQTGRDARYDRIDGPASVRLILPNTLSSAITVSVEVEATPRITAPEIVDLWTAAWGTATTTVPGVLVPDPETAALLAPPTVELHVKTYSPWPDPFDLSAFGDGQPGDEGAVTVVAPIGFDLLQRRHWAAKALTRLARGWGYADADESDLV
ncbi:toll/interleukin-1 receptor domain-containing protein [Amycolatopsis sp. NPDC004625]|uniref:toll/interleukin-1 receptor domain-containing protein n=1 Tax=Amycolatopsis sp. NPDC004625 TaxID=3154670 RepID=UPI0033B9DEAF